MYDKKYIDDLRDAINSSPVFYKEEEYIEKYNLTCAVMDRLESATRYLNEKIDKPRTEEEFLVFMMFACMVVDAIKELKRTYNIATREYDKHQYFKHAYIDEPLNLCEENYPTDDKFFEYFRSLTFAHPYETSRAKFIPKGQIQYSPWVIVNEAYSFTKIKNAVGVRIYFSNKADIEHLYVSFDSILEFVLSRYVEIEDITQWLREEVLQRKREWKKHVLIKEDDDILNLQNISRELKRRYYDEIGYEIDELLAFMSCECHCADNELAIENYRKNIHEIIPQIIDYVNDFDDEVIDIVSQLLRVARLNVPNSHYYQLQKMFEYLKVDSCSSDIEYALQQAEEFAKGFAKKWIRLEPRIMSFDEIRLLVTIAFQLEEKSQISDSEFTDK